MIYRILKYYKTQIHISNTAEETKRGKSELNLEITSCYGLAMNESMVILQFRINVDCNRYFPII